MSKLIELLPNPTTIVDLRTLEISIISTRRMLESTIGVEIADRIINDPHYIPYQGIAANGYLLGGNINHAPIYIQKWLAGTVDLPVFNLLTGELLSFNVNTMYTKILDDIYNRDSIYIYDLPNKRPLPTEEQIESVLGDNRSVWVSYWDDSDEMSLVEYPSIRDAAADLSTHTTLGELILSHISNGCYRHMDVRCAKDKYDLELEHDVRFMSTLNNTMLPALELYTHSEAVAIIVAALHCTESEASVRLFQGMVDTTDSASEKHHGLSLTKVTIKSGYLFTK